MFNIILKQIFHFITFFTISFLYDSDDNLSERMEGSHYGLERNQSHHSPPTKNMPRALLWAIILSLSVFSLHCLFSNKVFQFLL